MAEKTSSSKQKQECAICLEKMNSEFDAAWIYSCHPTHRFHRSCILNQNDKLVKSNACPHCGKPDTRLDNLQQIFLAIPHEGPTQRTFTFLYHPTETISQLHKLFRGIALSWAWFWHDGDDTGLFGCNITHRDCILRQNDERTLEEAKIDREATIRVSFPIILKPFTHALWYQKTNQ